MEEGGLLQFVEREGADCRAGGGVAAGVERFAAEARLELRGDEAPRAIVLRLLLAPDQAGVGVLRGDQGKALGVERIELLDADDGGGGVGCL